MRTFLVLIGIIVVMAVVNTTSGQQVKIKEVPIAPQQVKLTDGEELYVELCAVCHGKGGIGDGPAASALKSAVPDLTVLAATNDGKFPHKDVQKAIAGQFRADTRGQIGMPSWCRAFEGAKPEWRHFRRRAFAKQQVERLTDYLETIQAT